MQMTPTAAFKILVLGPNPAFQKVITFDSPVKIGGVNRASHVTQYVGGKGQGSAMALQRWNPGSAAVASFLGGDTGQYVEDELAAAGLDQIVQHTAAPTRTCTTLLCAGEDGGTELIDPSGAISEDELAGMLEKIRNYEVASSVGGIALCGTVPPGTEALYASVAKQMENDESILLLDGHKQVDDLLATGRVDVLKINQDEAKALTGEPSAEAAAKKLLTADGAPVRKLLALTDGPRPAKLFAKSGASWTLAVPKIECVNAIGSGDVCTAIFLHELVSSATKKENGSGDADADAVDAFAWGLAAAVARCMHELPSDATREEVEAMRAKVVIERS